MPLNPFAATTLGNLLERGRPRLLTRQYNQSLDLRTNLSSGNGTFDPPDGTIGPIIRAAASSAGAIEIAQAFEDLTGGPEGWTEDTVPSYWHFPSYYRVLVTNQFFPGALDGDRFGMQVGQRYNTSYAVLSGASERVHIGYWFDLALAKWVCQVNNPFGPTGNHTFTKLLPNSVGNTYPAGGGVAPYQLEVLYYPNDRIEFWLSGTVVYVLRDSEFSPYHPLLDIYNNANNVKALGMGLGLILGCSINSSATAGFYWPLAETVT